MIRVYICHPYTADPEGNVIKVRKLVEQFSQNALAKMATIDYKRYTADPAPYSDVFVPVSPMLAFPEFMSEAGGVKREHAMAFCIALLAGCDELWVCSRTISDGMSEEISWASVNSRKVVWKV